MGRGENDEALETLRTRGISCVLGNHEVDLIERYEIEGEHRVWIKAWPKLIQEHDVLYCHTWIENGFFRLIDSLFSASEMFASRDFRLAFVGHSHSPGWWESRPGDRPRWTHAKAGCEIYWAPEVRYIVDVGSLGEPHCDGDPNYVLWDEVGARWLRLP